MMLFLRAGVFAVNTRCYRCGWSLSIGHDTIVAALAQMQAAGGKYYVEHCPRCRQAVKIPLDQLRRALPRGEELPALPVIEAPPGSAPPRPAAAAATTAAALARVDGRPVPAQAAKPAAELK